MDRKKLSRAIGEIDPRFVSEAMVFETATVSRPENVFRRFWRERRVAACICLVLVAASVTFATAFAADAAFRKTVNSVLFPLYTSRDVKEIDEGHRTGNFDVQDTLFTFLDRFNREEMIAGLTAPKDHGYHYAMLSDRSGVVQTVVECNRSDYRLLVTMKLKPYRHTTGLWQVVSYQVIELQTAKTMLSEMKPYVSEVAPN